MSRLVTILAASTLATAGAALYYRHALVEEQARTAQYGASDGSAAQLPAVPVTPVVVEPVAPAVAARPAIVRNAASPEARQTTVASAVAAPAAAPARQRDAPRPGNVSPAMRERATQFLIRYEDPAARAGLLQATMPRARAELAGFDKERGLDAATFEKLTQLRAEFHLLETASRYRCAVYPDCTAYQGDSWDRHIEAVDALIGQGGYEHARSWTHSIPVRRIVNSLSSQLPARASLTTGQSNALIDELENERRSHLGGYTDVRQRFRPYSNSQGMEVLYSYDVLTAGERMASARAYSQRIRAVAATVLGGPQLATFNRMQDKALADLQVHLVVQQARRRAGS